MSQWPTKPLGELIAIEKGKKAPEIILAPTRSSLPYLQIEDLRPDTNFKYCEPFNCPIATKSDVIIAWDGANAGTVSCNLHGYIGSTLAVIRPTSASNLSPFFLSRFLESNFGYLRKTTTGAAIPHISKSALTVLRIPIPPLPEQERIVKLLDETDALRKLRAQADKRMAELIPALFEEMFGELGKNPKGWEKLSLSSCADRIVDCPHSTPNWQASGVVCVRTSNLGYGVWNWNDRRYVAELEYKERTQRSELIEGDIVLSREGTIGVAAIIPQGLRLCLGQRLVQVRPNPEIIDSAFLLQVLLQELAPENIGNEMAGSTSKHFNVGQLRALPILVPPLPLQNQFAARVAEIRAMEKEQAESKRRLDALFQAMLHRAFEGEI